MKPEDKNEKEPVRYIKLEMQTREQLCKLYHVSTKKIRAMLNHPDIAPLVCKRDLISIPAFKKILQIWGIPNGYLLTVDESEMH
ncbi:MAG: hypothetical protein MUF42_12120 [Cytophagaceae bacterium]|jgi:hypothetical protein|nr:hypothetical protein [Cytophagaceae bacterium]